MMRVAFGHGPLWRNGRRFGLKIRCRAAGVRVRIPPGAVNNARKMKLLVNCLWVGAAGSLGAVARFLLGRGCGQLFRTSFPVGTLLINLTGAFALGWLLKYLDERVVKMS